MYDGWLHTWFDAESVPKAESWAHLVLLWGVVIVNVNCKHLVNSSNKSHYDRKSTQDNCAWSLPLKVPLSIPTIELCHSGMWPILLLRTDHELHMWWLCRAYENSQSSDRHFLAKSNLDQTNLLYIINAEVIEFAK